MNFLLVSPTVPSGPSAMPTLRVIPAQLASNASSISGAITSNLDHLCNSELNFTQLGETSVSEKFTSGGN